MADGEEQAGRWRNIGGIALAGSAGLLMIFVFTDGFGGMVFRSAEQDFNSRSVEARRAVLLNERLEATVQSVRPQLPMRIDEVTALTDVKLDGRTISYIIDVAEEVPADEIGPYRSDVEREARARGCSEPDIRFLLESGATMVWQLRDLSGELFRVTVSSCDPPA